MPLFAYGTLMNGQENYHIIKPYVLSSKNGVAFGTLYALRGYPFMIPGRGRLVKGELFEPADEKKVLKMLDKFEGRKYRREEIKVRTMRNEEVTAIAYVYRGSGPPEGAVLIESGDWADYLKKLSAQT